MADLPDTKIDIDITPDPDDLRTQFEASLESPELLTHLKKKVVEMMEVMGLLDHTRQIPDKLRRKMREYKARTGKNPFVNEFTPGVRILNRLDIGCSFYFEDITEVSEIKKIGKERTENGMIYTTNSPEVNMRYFAYNYFLLTKAKECLYSILGGKYINVLDDIFSNIIISRSFSLTSSFSYRCVTVHDNLTEDTIKIITINHTEIEDEFGEGFNLHLKAIIHEIIHHFVGEIPGFKTPSSYRYDIHSGSNYSLRTPSTINTVNSLMNEMCTMYIEGRVTQALGIGEIAYSELEKEKESMHNDAFGLYQELAAKNLNIDNLIRLIGEINEELDQVGINVWTASRSKSSKYEEAKKVIRKKIREFV